MLYSFVPSEYAIPERTVRTYKIEYPLPTLLLIILIYENIGRRFNSGEPLNSDGKGDVVSNKTKIPLHGKE